MEYIQGVFGLYDFHCDLLWIPINMATSDFNFEEWAEASGLSRKTVKYLRTEELELTRALTMIDERDMISILVSMPLPLGQKKMLKTAIAELRSGNNKDTDPECHTVEEEPQAPSQVTQEGQGQINLTAIRGNDADLLATAGKTFDELLCIDQDKQVVTDNHSQFDPRAILTIKASKSKALHITDFLTEKTKKRRQARKKDLVLSMGGQNVDRVILKADDDHPYSGIFMSEWGAANCRLMNALLGKGILARDNVEYYLAYTARVFEFGQRYEWENVMDYDNRYRELQAEHGFHWGVVTPDMELCLLTQPRQGGQPGFQRRIRPEDATSNYTAHPQQGQQQDCKLSFQPLPLQTHPNKATTNVTAQ